MFESLKRRMILDESKKISENSLEIVLEEMSFDEELSESLGLNESVDDPSIEELIDEIPVDDNEMDDIDEDDFYEEEMKFLEDFISDPAPTGEQFTDIQDNYLDDDQIHSENMDLDIL